MTKSGQIRNDIIGALRNKAHLDSMEHFLNQQFRNIKADQEMIRVYILKAVAYLERTNKDLVKLEYENHKKKPGPTGFVSTVRSISRKVRSSKQKQDSN